MTAWVLSAADVGGDGGGVALADGAATQNPRRVSLLAS